MLSEDDLDESRFSNYLETSGMGEVDFLIRTAGEQRIYNYLLWQISYAELYFSEVGCPAIYWGRNKLFPSKIVRLKIQL